MRAIRMKALRKFNRIVKDQEFTANKGEARLFIKLGYAEIIADPTATNAVEQVAAVTREYTVDNTTTVRRRGRPARAMPEG